MEVLVAGEDFDGNDLTRGGVDKLLIIVQVERDNSIASPVERVKHDHVARTGGDGIGNAGHAVASNKVGERSGLDWVEFLHRELVDGFFAGGIGDAVVRVPGVLVRQDHVCPHATQARRVGGVLRVDQRRQRGEFFGRRRARFVLTLQRCGVCVGGDAILPIRAAVSADGGNVIAKLLRDVLERLVKSRVLNVRIGVDVIPLLRQCGLLREQVCIFHLRAEENGGVGVIAGVLIHLQEQRQRVVPGGEKRRQAEHKLHLHVVARIPEEHFLAIRPLPPEWRIFIQMALQQHRRTIVIAAGKQFVNPCRGEDRSVRPAERRNVGDVGVIEGRVVLAAEIGACVERADQSFRGGKAGEQVGILRRQIELLLLDGGDGALLLGRRARIEVLLQRPVSIEAEAKIRMLRDQLHGLIDDAAVDGGHFSLVVGISDIKMNVRDEEERPLLLRIDESFFVLLAPGNFCCGMRGKFGNREGKFFLAEILARVEEPDGSACRRV